MKSARVIRIVVILAGAVSMISFGVFINPSANQLESEPISESYATSDYLVDRWQVFPDMKRGRGDPGVVVVNGKIHAISGFWSPGLNYVFNQEVFDPLAGVWTSLGGIPEPRSDFVAIHHNGNIYTIGGWRDPIYTSYDEVGSLDFNHVYDLTVSRWYTDTEVTLPTPMSGAGGVVMDDYLYVIGGYTNALTNTNKVQIYDMVSNTWDEGIPMNSARSGLGVVELNGLIYAIGGQDQGDPVDVEIYDPATKIWSEGPAMPASRSSMAVAVRQGKIYVIGGFENTSNNFKNTVFIYDPDTDTWSIGDPMPTARHACRAAVFNDTIYVIGGVGAPGAGRATEAFGSFPPAMYLPLILKGN